MNTNNSVGILSSRIDSLAMALDVEFPSSSPSQVSSELLAEGNQGWNRHLENLGYQDDEFDSTLREDESTNFAADDTSSEEESKRREGERRKRLLNKNRNLFPKGSGNIKDLSSYQETQLGFPSSNWWIVSFAKWLRSVFWRG